MRKRILPRVMIGVMLVMLTGCASVQMQTRISSCQQMLANTFSVSNWIPRQERQALLALDALAPGSIVPTSLIGTFPCKYVPLPCQLLGVTCSSGHVTELSLANGNFVGEIPSELGNLSQLRMLSLANNQLSGEIPKELGNLSQLQEVWFHNNQLSGEIPAELGSLSQLGVLSLAGNQLSGSIPVELGNLSELRLLNLADNQLSGEVTVELGNLSQLHTLSLADNQLSGPLPGSLTDSAFISTLYLSNTELCIPPTAEFKAWMATIIHDLENVPYCE